jgi:hypothetical protein
MNVAWRGIWCPRPTVNEGWAALRDAENIEASISHARWSMYWTMLAHVVMLLL